MDNQLRLQQSTSLTITPQLQQAIQLLQLSYHELETFLQAHLEKNPFLITEDDAPSALPPTDALGPSFSQEILGSASRKFTELNEGNEAIIPASLTLRDHLMQQVGSQIICPQERLVGLYLVQFVQPTGYFDGDLEHIGKQLGVSPVKVEEILLQMQRFDPSGICARSLKECLRIQLADRDLLTPAYEILLNHLDLVARGDLPILARKCHVNGEKLTQMLQEIRSLSPKPGLIFHTDPSSLMVPEVLMNWDPLEKSWSIILNPDTLPKVLLNSSYYAQVRAHVTGAPDKRYLSEQMAHANWLIKALHQRSVTLLRVSTEIVRQQQDFFSLGISYLQPLILKDIAQTLDLHESTISRVTSHKYIATPRGTFELKYFFNSGLDSAHGKTISSESVRHRIQTLITQEPYAKPLSDDALAAILQAEGIDIARRTVAKYREILNLPPAFQRRRWKNLGVK